MPLLNAIAQRLRRFKDALVKGIAHVIDYNNTSSVLRFRRKHTSMVLRLPHRHLTVATLFLCCCMAARAEVRQDNPAEIRGAIYVSSGAYNAPQMWKNFTVTETKRDFGYARELHLNALRVWASYEFWKSNPKVFQRELDQMLEVAHGNGIRILLALFENDGISPTPENIADTGPLTGLDIQSPGMDIASEQHMDAWEQPRQFVVWFMKRYGNDPRLLAIEVMNEPGKNTMPFAKSMFSTAHDMQRTVPLTFGSVGVEQAQQFVPLGLNVIEFHDNFPASPGELADKIKTTMAYGAQVHLPVWLTEWQRVRPDGTGFKAGTKMTTEEKGPDYSTLAPTVQSFPIGNFFWSLMVKRAYLKGQRLNGTINGLFWPDGAVTSLKDARMIARDTKLELKERPVPSEVGDAPSLQ